MPELPEVETVRRGLEPVLLGRRFVDGGAHPSAKFAPATAVIDRTVAGVDRRGKYLLIGLDDGRRLVIHLGMTGQFRVHEHEPDDDPHVRAWWLLDDGRTLAFRDVRRFGRIAVVGEDVSALPTLAALGPEPFDPAFTAEGLRDAVNRSQARVKTQLLGQRVVAGVGNIYADEALWRARVHPASRRITRPAAARLREAIIDVLAEGIDHGGTTLRDYRTVEGGEGGNQHRLDCYGRAGLPCSRCGTILRRSVIDGRGTTHCPTCQRR
ncbi:MAG TPA: bifunctional DNA-formamidopyrimidine glycosylase/DNA-(apurinic or apyrimidinic site) lyase [Acidimicrobiales bacterium]|nr:bifunctional DNA-formamidopyrimidine glycosylase/DNA-(apurinic or apyrimidinic site) lyase [Acidimicrobiales bacterium]